MTIVRDEHAAHKGLAIIQKYEEAFLAAWTGHARWADSRNLMASLGLADRAPATTAAARPTVDRGAEGPADRRGKR